MAEERGIDLPEDATWDSLRQRSGIELTDHYIDVLRVLGRQPGILGDIFGGAQSRFTNPVNLKKLISMIDETHWTELGVDVKAAAFEGLLEKAASEGKKGAGQYFTPRLLIDAIVRCMKPDPREADDFTVADPACGTGGFLVSAYEWFINETGGALDRRLAARIRSATYYGQDLVPRPRRLALMNLYLHGIEPKITLGDTIYDPPSRDRYNVILTNPPFGTRGANQIPGRDDFAVETTNKQLNFLQHVLTALKPGGRAAVVVPDNVLFSDQGAEVLEVLTEDCRLHTVLRCPRGTFSPYTEGTKTNLLFFTKGEATDAVWIYDARANVPKITKQQRPLTPKHFSEFEYCYGADPNARGTRSETDSTQGRWRSFSIADIRDRGFNLDSFKWIRDVELDDPDDLPDPDALLDDALSELQAAVGELEDIRAFLEQGSAA
jgi:type I restriction enzyme M protein